MAYSINLLNFIVYRALGAHFPTILCRRSPPSSPRKPLQLVALCACIKRTNFFREIKYVQCTLAELKIDSFQFNMQCAVNHVARMLNIFHIFKSEWLSISTKSLHNCGFNPVPGSFFLFFFLLSANASVRWSERNVKLLCQHHRRVNESECLEIRIYD